jgi:hypothetical protein
LYNPVRDFEEGVQEKFPMVGFPGIVVKLAPSGRLIAERTMSLGELEYALTEKCTGTPTFTTLSSS